MNNLKQCFSCKNSLSLDQFHKNKAKSDGLDPSCKLCRKFRTSKFYEKNSSKIKKRTNLYYYQNKQAMSQASKEYRKRNAEKISQYKKSKRSIANEQDRARLKSNPLLNVIRACRRSMRSYIFNKQQSFNEYIGCSQDELRAHIESQFTEGMTWDNYGTWEIDHIFPLSKALNDRHVYRLSHYKNLRPLWVKENRSKNNSIEVCWQKVLRDITLDEDIKSGLPLNLEVKDFTFQNESLSKEHIEFIEKYEWLGVIGVGITHVFTSRWNGHLSGVIMMGSPNQAHFGDQEVLIQRGAVSGWSPKNLNSSLLMFSCRWMIQNTNKRIFTAYSDPEAGEIGTIYQACNFDFLGYEFGAKTLFKLPSGKEVNRRYFTRAAFVKKVLNKHDIPIPTSLKYNDLSSEIKRLLKLEMSVCSKRIPRKKGKYALLLNYGKDKLSKSWVTLKYPKRK